MFTLRCTRKLLKRLGATPSSAAMAPSTVLGDWTANLLYTRPTPLVVRSQRLISQCQPPLVWTVNTTDSPRSRRTV